VTGDLLTQKARARVVSRLIFRSYYFKFELFLDKIEQGDKDSGSGVSGYRL
jgi:hypothetical protein